MRILSSVNGRPSSIASVALFVLLLLTGLNARATTLIAFPAPNVNLDFANTSGIITGTNVLGSAILSDSSASNFAYLTDLGAPAPHNTILFGVNLSATQFLAVSFDPNTLSVSADGLHASLLGQAVPLTPTTDPILKILLAGSGIGQYDFQFLSSDSQFGVNIENFGLIAVEVASVPEPSTFAPILAGLAGGLLALRRRNRDSAAGRGLLTVGIGS